MDDHPYISFVTSYKMEGPLMKIYLVFLCISSFLSWFSSSSTFFYKNMWIYCLYYLTFKLFVNYYCIIQIYYGNSKDQILNINNLLFEN